MPKQAKWAQSPNRVLLGTCPDCDEIVYLTVRCVFNHRDGAISAQMRVDPVVHVCDEASWLDEVA